MASEYQTLFDIGDSGGGRNPVQETRFKELQTQQGGGVNLNAGMDAVNAQRANNTTFLNNQNALTSGFLDKYTNTIRGQGSTSAAAEQIGNEVGLPGLQKNAFNLNEQLLGIPSTYKAGTRGFDVNANQLSRIINQKTSEIAPIAQEAGRQAQFAENTVNTRLGYLQNDWQRELLPLNTEKDFLTDRMARETSMYTQENQNELNAILAKIQTGVQINEAEKDRAQQLSMAERGYEEALKLAQFGVDNGNPYVSVGAGTNLFNTRTGQVDYTAPRAPSQGTTAPRATYNPPNTSTNNGSVYNPPPGQFNWKQYGL